jgi:hypothetical protein
MSMMIDRADVDAFVALAHRHDLVDQRRKAPGHLQVVSQQPFGDGVAGAFHPGFVLRLVMTHHNHRRMVVAFHQQARLFPD